MMQGTRLSIIPVALALSSAQAQTTIDVAKISCNQFVLRQVASPENLTIWLSGYYHGKRSSTTINVEQLEEQSETIRTYCLYKDRNATLLEATEKLMEGK